MQLRAIEPSDRAPIEGLLQRIENFSAEEVQVALELIDGSLAGPHTGYQVMVAEEEGALLGYLCFGPTPMTERTFDLYWVAVDSASRGRGVGRALCRALEEKIELGGGGIIRVETSTQDA